MSTPILEIKNIDVSYGQIQALHNVSLSIDEGEIVTLIGSNGAGKSTLLLSIFGNPRAHNGTISYKGNDITNIQTYDVSKLGISLVPEGRHIFPKMTVLENILMGAFPRNNEYEAEDIEKIFSLFPILKERKKQTAGTLSGGEQQMLAIGRALLSKPKLLLLDEPSLGLAPIIVSDIFSIIRNIAKQGTTIFLIEQNAGRALRLADRGYVLVNGTIKSRGTGRELLENPQIKAAYLGEH